MNKLSLFLLAVAAFVCQVMLADTAKVTLKSGVEVKGTIISFDPTSEIVLDVAGFTTKINMLDVESVEGIVEEPTESIDFVPVNKVSPGEHPAITLKGEIIIGKKNKQHIQVSNDEGQIMTMVFESEQDKTLKVISPKKDFFYYTETKLIIPEYVVIEGEIYTVVSIGKRAFYNPTSSLDPTPTLEEIILPQTLKIIEDQSFYGLNKLKKIIIPDSVETIGEESFRHCGCKNKSFEQLYIPENVKSIGEDAFRNVGKKTSYRGYFQGSLTSMPSFITVGNCLGYGIDEEAVEDYYRRNGIQ